MSYTTTSLIRNGRFSACSAGFLFADISPRPISVHYALEQRRIAAVLSRLMDSAFAHYYRTLGQFYESRLVHGSFTPGQPARDPSNGGANSVFIDNDLGGTIVARGKYRTRKFEVIYERLLPLRRRLRSRESDRKSVRRANRSSSRSG